MRKHGSSPHNKNDTEETEIADLDSGCAVSPGSTTRQCLSVSQGRETWLMWPSKFAFHKEVMGAKSARSLLDPTFPDRLSRIKIFRARQHKQKMNFRCVSIGHVTPELLGMSVWRIPESHKIAMDGSNGIDHIQMIGRRITLCLLSKTRACLRRSECSE